jgi:hypothetical protein
MMFGQWFIQNHSILRLDSNFTDTSGLVITMEPLIDPAAAASAVGLADMSLPSSLTCAPAPAVPSCDPSAAGCSPTAAAVCQQAWFIKLYPTARTQCNING